MTNVPRVRGTFCFFAAAGGALCCEVLVEGAEALALKEVKWKGQSKRGREPRSFFPQLTGDYLEEFRK